MLDQALLTETRMPSGRVRRVLRFERERRFEFAVDVTNITCLRKDAFRTRDE